MVNKKDFLTFFLKVLTKNLRTLSAFSSSSFSKTTSQLLGEFFERKQEFETKKVQWIFTYFDRTFLTRLLELYSPSPEQMGEKKLENKLFQFFLFIDFTGKLSNFLQAVKNCVSRVRKNFLATKTSEKNFHNALSLQEKVCQHLSNFIHESCVLLRVLLGEKKNSNKTYPQFSFRKWSKHF